METPNDSDVLADVERESHELTILTIYEDKVGDLWLGTVGRGLIYYNPDTGASRLYSEKDGLPNETIYGILPDHHGSLWMSTNNGLVHFNPQTKQFKVYTAKDGLQSNEFNSYAYYKNPMGELFFGGINGVTAFLPSNLIDNRYKPPIVLTSLITQSELQTSIPDLNYLDAVELRYPENSFEFEFAALNYVQPEENQYAYMLENFDRDWIYSKDRNFGRYTNLPGGHYSLRLKATNSDGVWNEAAIPLSVRVVPPIWETDWFRVGLFLGILLTAFVGYRLRVRSVLNRSRQLESLVDERTREIEHGREQLEALYAADEALYRNLFLDQVLNALVESAVNLLHADKGSLLVIDKTQNRLIPQVAYGFLPETIQRLALPLGEGIAGLVAQTGEPILVEDVTKDPRVSRSITDAEGICSFMQVPIRVGGEIFGTFSADFLAPRTFEEDELRLLMSLAQRAAQAIQNAQLYERTQEQAVIEERNRLARELHDAVTQTLFSASLIAEALPTAFDTDLEEGRALLSELRQLNRGALAEMRTLLMELRPSALAEAELPDLLHQLGEAASGREGVPVLVKTDLEFDLPVDVHIAFYRIAQEALNNALKHARAHQIQIILDHNHSAVAPPDLSINGCTRLIVCDDGRGFDKDQIPADHLGLKIMQERAQSVSAQLTIQTQRGKGTEVAVLWENKRL